MSEEERRHRAQADLAAYTIARNEAAAWAAARDVIADCATSSCRDILGMSIRETANELGISRSTLARTMWKGISGSDHSSMSAEVADLHRKHLDEVWIRVGQPESASPEGQFAAGLIDEFERDAQLDIGRRAMVPIAEQIRDAVRRYPGVDSVDLPRLLVWGFGSRFPDLRHHAEDAECMVDGSRRWWPTKTVRDLTRGEQIPRLLGHFNDGGTYEWVTVDSITGDDVFDEFVDVKFRTAAGDVESWSGVPHHERHPVRTWS